MPDQKKKAAPIVSGVKVSDKKSIKDAFIAKDGKTVAHSLTFDVVIPSIKKVFYDIFTKGLGMFMFGEAPSTTSNVNYSRPYTSVSFKPYNEILMGQPTQKQTPTTQSVLDYDKFVYPSRSDAERVLEQMIDIIDTYGVVSVSDLYDMVDKTAPYTAENYGWNNLANAKVTVGSEGFMLLLPKAYPINK